MKRFFGGGSTAGMVRVQLRTDPKGARIVVNRRPLIEVTPADLLFPEGIYEVTLMAPGYKSIHKTIDAGVGGPVKVEEHMEKD